MAEANVRVKLITHSTKLKDAFPDLAAEYGDDAEFIRKGLTPSDLKVDEGERAIISYITTAAKDRDGEIVLPSGADLKHYRKNPVVLFGHDYRTLPIGKNIWIKADEKGLIGKTQYANHEEAEKVYQYRKDGFPLAVSIGFIPLKAYHKKWKDGGYKWDDGDLRILNDDHGLTENDVKDVWAVYTKWSLLEYSDVPVPANPEATELAKSKGLFGDKDKAKVTVWDTEGNVVQVDTENTSDAVMTLDTQIDEKSATVKEETTLETLAASMKTLTESVLSIAGAVKGLQDIQIKEPAQELVQLDFIETDQPLIDFTAEDIKSAVEEVLETTKAGQIINVKETIAEAMSKMKGKVVVEE